MYWNGYYRRNSDEKIRKLEREAQGGDPEAVQNLKLAYTRVGAQPPQSTDVRLSYFERRGLAEALETDHPCDEISCDISAALGNGFEEVAAYLLLGATECSSLEQHIEDNGTDLFGANIFGEPFAFPRGWDRWVKWFEDNAIKCSSCGAFNFPDEFGDLEYCGDCNEELPKPATCDSCGSEEFVSPTFCNMTHCAECFDAVDEDHEDCGWDGED